MDNKNLVWIGCVNCYDEGELVGGWYSTEEADTISCEDIHKQSTDHEDTIIYGLDDNILDPELSIEESMERIRLATKAWNERQIPGYILRDYIIDVGGYWTDDTVDIAIDSYMGEHDSDIEFAQNMAEELGLDISKLEWPQRCIDWEYAAKELMYDYISVDHHYFICS